MDFNLNLWPLFIAAIVGVTLGLWKLVEIIIWICQHLTWV